MPPFSVPHQGANAFAEDFQEDFAEDLDGPRADDAAADNVFDCAHDARSDGVNAEAIPAEMKAWPQWVVWWRGDRRPDGRYAKVPYAPRTGTLAKTNDPTTWGTFQQAWAAYLQQGYDGLGFVLQADDPYLVLDLDGCRDPRTGALTTEAEVLVARFDTYTEVSPSGTGVHVFMQAPSPAGVNVVKPYEVYSIGHLITVTGERLPDAPATVAPRQAALEAWYAATFPQAAAGKRATSADASGPFAQALPPTTDEAIVRQVQRSSKAAKLWAGDGSDYASPSHADAALVGCLARWTRDPDQLLRLVRRSGLYRDKWNREDYAQTTITRVLAVVDVSQRPARREEQRIIRTYDWQRREEAPGERTAYLAAKAEEAKERVRAHIEAIKAGEVVAPVVVTLAPGVGKTRVVGTLGDAYNLGWAAIRRNLHKELAESAAYRFIERCQPDNCPDAARMNRLASWRRTVMPLHRRHENGNGCGYYRQFQEKGSAFYRVEHLPSGYLLDHDAVVVDELEPLKWLKALTLSVNDLVEARRSPQWVHPDGFAVLTLLEALQRVLEQAHGTLHGKTLVDALNAHMNESLAFRLEQASAVPGLWDERPKVHEEADIEYAEQEGAVIVPYLMQWLREDLPKWQQGSEWNSRARVTLQGRRPVFQLQTPLRPAAGNKLAILDATANVEVLSRLLGQPVQVERQEVIPPPRMRHVGVRIRRPNGSIQRYGKSSLVDGPHAERTRDRVVREAQHLLARENPDGSRTVGLITHQGCQEALGEALGVPADRCGHFWGVRGSNDWEDCDILLVIGTPTPRPDTVAWAARTLYADDPTPLDTTAETTEHGRRYCDPRLASLLDYLVNSELTQAAHRNRPIRHDGRVVISFTSGVVDYLPMTEEVVAFGSLPTQRQQNRKEATRREQEQRLDTAYERLVARGEAMTVRVLAREAQVQTTVAGAYLRARRRNEEERYPTVQQQ